MLSFRRPTVAAAGGSTYIIVAAYQSNGVQIIDVSNPSSPAAVATLTDNGSRYLKRPESVVTFTIGARGRAPLLGLADAARVLMRRAC